MIKAEIDKVIAGSIAEELEIEVGDFLLKIDGKDINDIIEYERAIYKEYIEIEVLKKDINEIWEFEIEKDWDEELGLDFKKPVFDGIKTCQNNCLFCFVDQQPKNLRKSLCIKDEDFRTSFLYGSYMTLSNMGDKDMKRIIDQKLSPLYISVHATDPEVRVSLLRNKKAGDLISKMKKLVDNGIELHTQIVLIPEINDGKILEKTIKDLESLYPMVKSVTVVPIGLTKYHKNSLRLFTEDECARITKYLLLKAREYKNLWGTNFIFTSDEFFVKSKIDVPENEYYENFEHLENGVGLLRLILEEEKDIRELKGKYKKKGTIACGVSLYPYLTEIFIDELNINIKAIKNYFWGETITVTGLITGSDLIENLKDSDIGDELIINRVMLNDNREFLDDKTVEDVEKALNTKIRIIEKLEEIYK